MGKRKSISVWIDEALVDPDKVKADGSVARCCVMTLVHMNGSQQIEVHSMRFGTGKSWQGHDIAEFMRGKAEVYAQDLVGIQTFQILAFYEEDLSPSRYIFTIAQSVDPTTAVFEPTDAGERQQKNVWTTAILSQVYRRQEVMDQHAMRHIETLSVMLQRAVQAQESATEMCRELILQRVMSDREHELTMLDRQRKIDLQKGLFKIAPPLINTITGRNVFPQETEDTAIVEALCELDPEKVLGALGSMGVPNELAGVLMARVVKYHEKKRAEEKLEEQSRRIGPPQNPELEAAGGGH